MHHVTRTFFFPFTSLLPEITKTKLETSLCGKSAHSSGTSCRRAPVVHGRVGFSKLQTVNHQVLYYSCSLQWQWRQSWTFTWTMNLKALLLLSIQCGRLFNYIVSSGANCYVVIQEFNSSACSKEVCACFISYYSITTSAIIECFSGPCSAGLNSSAHYWVTGLSWSTVHSVGSCDAPGPHQPLW